MLTPGPNRARPPAFHEMDPDQFEEIVRALHDKEPGIARTTLYRTKRKPQFGVDSLSERSDGAAEVASCKRYAKLDKGEIAEFSDDFLRHWEAHWRPKGVRRFVLATAAHVHSAERDAEIEAEKARFATLGIAYEVWAPHQLLEKLRPHRGIVSQYLGEYWVSVICGEAPSQIQPAGTGRDFLDALAVSQVAKLQEALSEQVGHQLDGLLERLRGGDLAAAEAALNELRAGTAWAALNAPIRARVLRLRASTRLQRGDAAGAARLADEADALAPSDEPRLRAVLAERSEGPHRALEVLGKPKSQDGAHLRVGLLLAAGDLASATAVLDAHPAVDPAHPETSRLRALVALLAGDRDAALRHADAAMRGAPSWPAVQRAAAVARYASALSPALGPDSWLQPNPVDLDLVREDDASQARLAEALDRFDALALRDTDPDLRRESEEFAFACLCNMRDRLSEAEARCAAMLAADPARAVVAAWALARGFSIDREALAAALRARLASGEPDGEQVLLLAVLKDEAGRPREALAVVESQSAAFTATPAARALRDRWADEFKRRAAPQASATAEAGESEPASARRLAALAGAAHAAGDWSAVEAFIFDLAAEARPNALLLPAAQMLAAAGRWASVAPHVPRLLAFGTAEATRLAAFAVFMAGRPRDALAIIDGHRQAFPRGRLPLDLRRMEVQALAQAGDPASALRRAAALAADEEAGAEDRLLGAVAHLHTGDVEGAAKLIRDAQESGPVDPDRALRLAHAVAVADPGLAERLWRQAVAEGVPAALSASAMALAFRLGLDRDAAPIVAGLPELASQPESGVRAFTLDEMVEEFRARREHGDKVAESHLRGEIPIHVAAAATGANLAELLSLAAPGNAATELTRYPQLMMSGRRGRSGPALPPLRGARLFIDITALLVADQLGLLDALDRLPAPPRVAPSLPAALLELEHGLRHHQPSRLASARAVVDAARDRHAAAASPSQSRSAPALELWTVQHRAEAPVAAPDAPDEAGHRRTNLRAVADALLLEGAIAPDAHAAAVADLGSAGREPPSGAPGAGHALLLEGSTAAELAAAGLLPAALATFDVRVAEEAVAMAAAEVARAAAAARVADRVRALRTRIAQALRAGRLSTIPVAEAVGGDEAAESAAPRSAVFECLAELVRAPGEEGGLVWTDDRMLSGYPDCNGSTIASTPEMLGAFCEAGLLTPEARWAAMARLRAARAMFVPVEAEEVLHHLAAAPLAEGGVVETPALAALRRNVAGALLHARHLAIGPVAEGGGVPGEAPFLLALRGVAERAILEIWTREDGTDEARRARSDWVWAALRVDRIPRLPLDGSGGHAAAARATLVLRTAGLLANGLQVVFGVEPPHRERRLRAYMAWVERSALPPWLGKDEELSRPVASALSGLLVPLVDDADPVFTGFPGALRGVRASIARVAAELPDAVQAGLVREPRFARVFGDAVRKVVTIDGRGFEPGAFWKAVRRALSTGSASVPTADGKGELAIRRSAGPRPAVAFSGALDGGWDDPMLALLDPSRKAKRAAARRLVAGLGMPPREVPAAVDALSVPGSAPDRIDALAGLRERSASFRYAALRGRLQRPGDVLWDDFAPPDPGVLLSHLCFEPAPGTPFVARLEAASAELLRGFGAAEAVRRLAALPVPLPRPVLDAVRALPASERLDLLREMGGPTATPLRWLHALRLHRDSDEAGIGEAEVCDAALAFMIDGWPAAARLFCAVLRQGAGALRGRAARRGVDGPADALAASWAHADLVTLALAQAGCDLDEAAAAFRDRPDGGGPVEATMARDPAVDGAAASPHALAPEALLFHGLGYALGERRPAGAASFPSGRLEALRELVSVGAAGQRAPSPWLFADRAGADNGFGSWMAARPAWLFAAPVDLSEAGARTAVSGALSGLSEGGSDKAELWTMLGALARPALGPDARGLAAAALRLARFVPLVEADRERGLAALRGAGELVAAAEEASAFEAVAGQLEAVARHLAGVYPSRFRPPGPAPDAVAELLEAAAAASGASDGETGWSRFAALALRITEAWPAATLTMREVLGALAAATRPVVDASLLDAWMRLRAMD